MMYSAVSRNPSDPLLYPPTPPGAPLRFEIQVVLLAAGHYLLHVADE